MHSNKKPGQARLFASSKEQLQSIHSLCTIEKHRQLYLPQATGLADGFEREDSPTRTPEIHPTKLVPPFPA